MRDDRADTTLKGLSTMVNVIRFQRDCAAWAKTCFGAKTARSRVERNHRFLEEALELVQAHGCTRDEAHQLVDYVFDRPVGEPDQELGGVMVTLATLAAANDQDMTEAGLAELDRVWGLIDKIRRKHANKPKIGPLPGDAA